MKLFKTFLFEQTHFTTSQAKELGDSLRVDWTIVDLEQFRKGLAVEKEHDQDDELDVVKNNKQLAKIVLAHLKELPDYYDRLAKMEKGNN